MLRLSRDSAIWWFGLIGGVATALLASTDLLELPRQVNLWLLRTSVVTAAMSGWMKNSFLPSKQAADVGAATAKVVESRRALAKAERAAIPTPPDEAA
jgi:NhaP-type Na+/H+ or K+/H+ antiporter